MQRTRGQRPRLFVVESVRAFSVISSARPLRPSAFELRLPPRSTGADLDLPRLGRGRLWQRHLEHAIGELRGHLTGVDLSRQAELPHEPAVASLDDVPARAVLAFLDYLFLLDYLIFKKTHNL